MMDCFEFQNKSSDNIDALLAPLDQARAMEHLDACESCQAKINHYQILLDAIANLPKVPLPEPLRKAPFSGPLPRLDISGGEKNRWERLPWYLRSLIEGVGTIVLVLIGISAGPKLRSLYERQTEHNLSEYNEPISALTAPTSTESGETSESSEAALQRGKILPNAAAPKNEASSEEAEENAYEGDSEGASVEAGGNQEDTGSDIRVGNSEIWRFSLKTDNPREVREKVVKILGDLKVPRNTPGFGGVEAPGGIQFDLLVPQSVIPNLKNQLQKLAPTASKELAKSTMGETFTWYKNKSKKPMPARTSRIVIWLSQF
ncbi:hypothetical protein WDW86_11130 [Bdellovibrionota bacterium FG-2]